MCKPIARGPLVLYAVLQMARLFRVVFLILAVARLGPAAVEPQRVLLLYSYGRQQGPFDIFTEGFRVELQRQSARRVEFYEVTLEPDGPSAPSEEALLGFLHSIYASRPPDLILPIGGPASKFAHRHRQELFPDTPMLMAAVDERHFEKATLAPTETVVAVKTDPVQTIENIRRILPRTKTIFVVVGDSPQDRFWREDLGREFQRFQNQLTFVWSNDLSFAEILKRSATLPPDSAILYALLSVDAAGVPHTELDTLTELHASANAPIFGMEGSQMGRGIVGGPLMSMQDLSYKTAGVAARLLGHESPAAIKTPVQEAGPGVFDCRELRRWNISEDLLPDGSIVQFREPTLWQRYRWYVLGSVLVFLAEALLISSLLANLTRRRRAETSLLESREALSRMSQRLIETQENERTRIAFELHDDINQRLAALVLQLDLFARSLPASMDHTQQDLTAARRNVGELIGDIRSLSHRLHSPTLEIIGLSRAAEALCREFSAAQQIDIEFRSDSISKDFPADIGLCLYRVLQEALQNMAKHSRTTKGQVVLTKGPDAVEIIVSDEGAGFNPVEVFFGDGLGLPSMKERLKSLGGQISIESRPGRGTVIHARVPLESRKQAARTG